MASPPPPSELSPSSYRMTIGVAMRYSESLTTLPHYLVPVEPNKRMHQSGRGRRLAPGWHGQTSCHNVPRPRRAPQVKRWC